MRVVQLLVGLVLLVMVAGCTPAGLNFESGGGSSGAPPSGGHGGIEITGSGGAPTCDEDCPAVPDGWSLPALVATGPFSDLAACPDIA